jgi:hypothetical protein
VQVPRIGVQHEHLLGRRLHDTRVAVTHVGHVVVCVQVSPSGVVVEVLHPAAYDLDRLSICHGQVRPDDTAARLERFLRRLAAHLAKGRLHVVHVQRGERRKRPPDRALADTQIGVAGTLCLLPGGDTDTGAQAQQHQPEQRGELLVIERTDLLVAAYDRHRGIERIGLAEDGVGNGDGEVGDRVGVHDIAEIDDSGDLPIDKDVVVVWIVMRRRAAKAGESGAVALRDPARDVLHQSAQRGVGD